MGKPGIGFTHPDRLAAIGAVFWAAIIVAAIYYWDLI